MSINDYYTMRDNVLMIQKNAMQEKGTNQASDTIGRRHSRCVLFNEKGGKRNIFHHFPSFSLVHHGDRYAPLKESYKNKSYLHKLKKNKPHQHSLQMELSCNSQIKILPKRVMVCNEWPSFSTTSCTLLNKISRETKFRL